MTNHAAEFGQRRYLPLAPWRVKVWRDQDGTWSARYRRVYPLSTESWTVGTEATRRSARRALTVFVRADKRTSKPTGEAPS